MIMTNREELLELRKIVEKNPDYSKIKKLLKKLFDLDITKEEFTSFSVSDKEEIIPSFKIVCKNRNIKINIGKEGYNIIYMSKEGDVIYDFKNYYDSNIIASQSFTIKESDNSLTIKDEDTSKTVSINNNNTSLTRTYDEKVVFDNDSFQFCYEIHTNKLETDDIKQYNELFFFPGFYSMYHIQVCSVYDEYKYQAAASLGIPEFEMSPISINKTVIDLFDKIGARCGSVYNNPKIVFTCHYPDDNYINYLNIEVTKYYNMLRLDVRDNEERCVINITGSNYQELTIDDLLLLKEKIHIPLKNNICLKLYLNYIDELIERAEKVISTELTNNPPNYNPSVLSDINDIYDDTDLSNRITSYNEDIFDLFINEGRTIFCKKAKDFLERTQDLMAYKDSLDSLIASIKIPDIKLNKTEKTIKM